MTSIFLTFFLILIFSMLAGFLGSLTGLGGGTVLVPLLTLYLGIPIIYATGSSLISTIATSSGSASAYVKERITSVRIGISLEIATTAGSIVGSLTVAYIYSLRLEYVIYIVFGIVLLFSIYPTLSKMKGRVPSSQGSRLDN